MNISVVVLFIVLIILIIVVYYFIFDIKHGSDEAIGKSNGETRASNRTNPIYLDQESFEQIKDKMTVMTVSPSSNSKFTTNIVYLNGTEFQYR